MFKYDNKSIYSIIKKVSRTRERQFPEVVRMSDRDIIILVCSFKSILVFNISGCKKRICIIIGLIKLKNVLILLLGPNPKCLCMHQWTGKIFEKKMSEKNILSIDPKEKYPKNKYL